jgi:hypothetical protein
MVNVTPPWIRNCSNNGCTVSTLDGLGRTSVTTNADGGPAEMQYDSCGCSPLGKMVRAAMPHAQGTQPSAWTNYTYDGIGRTA